MKDKVLITGGAGFIGSHLTEAYLEHGYEVVVVDIKKRPTYFDKLNLKYYQQDINKEALAEIIAREKPEIINHHAALINVAKSLKDPTTYTKTNVLATVKLLELVKKYAIRHFIFPSSAAIYGNLNQLPLRENSILNPDSFYGLDKLLAEYFIKLYRQYFKTTIFRYANVYGPRQIADAEGGVVAIFCQALALGKRPQIFGDGLQSRDFIFVKDVVKANIMVSLKKLEGTFQVSCGKSVSINELYHQLLKISGLKLKPIDKPERKGDIKHSLLDNQKLKDSLGWQAEFSLNQGLRQTWAYFCK